LAPRTGSFRVLPAISDRAAIVVIQRYANVYCGQL